MSNRPSPPSSRLPLLARLRVGTKLMLLVLLPVCGLLAFMIVSAIHDWQEANRLRDFRTATRLSFATAGLADALAAERGATALAILRPGADGKADVATAQRDTRDALRRAAARAATQGDGVDVAGRLDAARRQLAALRLQTRIGSLSDQDVTQAYGAIIHDLLVTVSDLDASRPTRSSGRAADAYVAMLQAIEAAERERVDLAAQFAHPSGAQTPTASRWVSLEAAALDAFRQNAAPRLSADLDASLFDAAGIGVRRVRDGLADPGGANEHVSLNDWLSTSGRRIGNLRRLEQAAAGDLAAAATHDLDAAQTRGIRDLVVSLALLLVVATLAMALRRSITRPLEEVSQGARMLSRGDLSFDVDYVGRDEIGDVAAAFRDLHLTAERLAGELRAMNAAVVDSRLEHRADVAAFEGTWAQLLAGMNETMAAFAFLQDQRERAEREVANIFKLSMDLLGTAGIDGYFKRINPAFERTLGYTREELLSKPFLDFVHPEDRERTRDSLRDLARGREVPHFENRYLRRDGSERWLQWGARPVPDEGLVYFAARDVTEARRAAEEQAALRRVATLVAQAVQPTEVFGAVAEEVGGLLRTTSAYLLSYDHDGSVTVLGSADGHGPTKDGHQHGRLAAAVRRTRRAARVGHSVAAPIVVEDRLWGAIVAESEKPEAPPADTERRLTAFAELVGIAIANAHSRAELAASRARVVTASDETRRRIERDLHDGVQQRLVSLGLALRAVEAMVSSGTSPAQLEAQVSNVVDGLTGTLDELLEISRGIHPAILSRGGLTPALRTLARRSAVPVELDLQPGLSLADRLEVALYYVVSESLTNVAKHSGASVVELRLGANEQHVELSIRDDGIGGADVGTGSGLIGLIDRVEAVGGRIRIDSPPGAGTAILVTMPLAED